MTQESSSFGWQSAEEYAAEGDMSVSEVVSYILDGALQGSRFGNRWYVAPALAILDSPTRGSDVVHLRLAVFRMANYLTAGRQELVIPLSMESLEPAAVFARITAAMKRTPNEPLGVTLNGEPWRVDSSLWLDLSTALLEFQILATGCTDPAAMRFDLGLPEAR